MIELDVHAHLAPINPVRLTKLAGVQWCEKERVLQVDDHRVAIRDLFEPQRLIDWMDSHHVVRALVSIPPPLYRQQLDPIGALAYGAASEFLGLQVPVLLGCLLCLLAWRRTRAQLPRIAPVLEGSETLAAN